MIGQTITLKQSAYLTIYEEIRRQITHGELRADTRLPAERNLQEAFGASRAMVRKAAALLEQDGLVERRGERGLFISPRPEDASARAGHSAADAGVSGAATTFQLFYPMANHPGGTTLHPEFVHHLSVKTGNITLTPSPEGVRFAAMARQRERSVASRVIFYGGYEPDAEDEAWLRGHGRVGVTIGRPTDCGIPQVGGDHIFGCRLLIRHLLQRGHTRILLVTGGSRHILHEELRNGYEAAIRENGLPFDPERIVKMVPYIPVPTCGQLAAQKVLERGCDATAVIVSGAWQSYGFFQAMTAAGHRIPEDLAFAAYLHQPWLDAACGFPVTGIVENCESLVEVALEVLDMQTRGLTPPSRQKVANTTLLAQRSCGEAAGPGPTP